MASSRRPPQFPAGPARAAIGRALREEIVSSRHAQERAAQEARELSHRLAACIDNTRLLELRQAELAAVKDQAIADVHREQQIVVDQLSAAQGNLARSLRNVALVRFDAFDDLSGRASFALALLDDAGDGITLTSIAGRTDSRTYAKGIVAGKCEQELSPEESEAVAAAVAQPGDCGAKLSNFVARRRAS